MTAFGSGKIEGTRATRTGSFEHMQVDHRRFDTGMPHEGLDGADVGSRLEQMGGVAVWHVNPVSTEILRTLQPKTRFSSSENG